jgi:hypothetical protein
MRSETHIITHNNIDSPGTVTSHCGKYARCARSRAHVHSPTHERATAELCKGVIISLAHQHPLYPTSIGSKKWKCSKVTQGSTSTRSLVTQGLLCPNRHSGHHAGPTLAAGACTRLSGCIIISPRRGVRWNWFVGDRGSRNACMVGRCAGSGAEVFVLGGAGSVIWLLGHANLLKLTRARAHGRSHAHANVCHIR